MTTREFYNWQTQGGADDVSRAVAALDGAGIAWCAIGGIAVNRTRDRVDQHVAAADSATGEA